MQIKHGLSCAKGGQWCIDDPRRGDLGGACGHFRGAYREALVAYCFVNVVYLQLAGPCMNPHVPICFKHSVAAALLTANSS